MVAAPVPILPRAMVGSSTSRNRLRGTAGIGLLSARVIVAARRVLRGRGLDETDRAVLARASEYLRDEASVLTYVETGGHVPAPSRRLAGAGIAAGVLRQIGLHGDQHGGDGQDAQTDSAAVTGLAERIDDFAREPTADVAEQLQRVFGRMSSAARAITGSSGDRVLGRPTPQP